MSDWWLSVINLPVKHDAKFTRALPFTRNQPSHFELGGRNRIYRHL
jgi:hypothetical protein